MKRGLFAAVACLVMAGSLIASEEPAKDAPKAPAGKPKIKFDQLVYDFGKTAQVERVSGTFVFHNVGDAVLKMGKPTTSCGCTVAGVEPEVVPPGSKGELKFTLNLGKARAVVQKQITVDCNDPETPRTVLTVKADYTPLYQLFPASFYLNIRKGDATNLTALVTRSDGQPFTIAKLQPSQPWIEATSEPDSNSTNHAVRVHATIKPEGTPRYLSESVNLFMEGSEQPNFSLTFNGRLVGDLTLTPESLYFPISDPTKAITARRIILKSALPEKLEVTHLTTTLQGMEVQAVAKEDGKGFEIMAKLATVPERTTNGVIRFDTNLPSQPHVEVPVWVNVMNVKK